MIKNINKTVLTVIGSILLATTLFSCKSTKQENMEELTASQLIQRGQDAYDKGFYNKALPYFEAVLKYYGDESKRYIEATYEIGHLYMKKKNYEKAYNCFTEILEIFDNSTTDMDLPTAYKVLAKIELDKIKPAEMEKIQQKILDREADLENEARKVAEEEKAREAARAATEKAAKERIEAEMKKAREAEEAQKAKDAEKAPETELEQNAEVEEPAQEVPEEITETPEPAETVSE